jgi:hypothetical protein
MTNIKHRKVAELDLTIFEMLKPVSADEIVAYSTQIHGDQPSQNVIWVISRGCLDNLFVTDLKKISASAQEINILRPDGLTVWVTDRRPEHTLTRLYTEFTTAGAGPTDKYINCSSVDEAISRVRDHQQKRQPTS